MNPEVIPIVLLAVMPTSIVGIVSYFRYKTKALAIRAEMDQRAVAAMGERQAKLEGRVQVLESALCSADAELDRRLRQLGAAERDRLPARPEGDR
jgi:hypothetical protein